jgi:hypothetical protein
MKECLRHATGGTGGGPSALQPAHRCLPVCARHKADDLHESRPCEIYTTSLRLETVKHELAILPGSGLLPCVTSIFPTLMLK